MNSKLRYFCYRPWTHLQVKASGALKFCCDSTSTIYDQTGLAARVITSEADQVLNSPIMMNVRKAMMNDQQHPSCQKCWLVENSHGASLRKKINTRWEHEIDQEELLRGTQPDGRLDSPRVYEFEFRLGNLCNLRCRMCSPLNSSKLVSEYVALKKTSLVREDQETIDLNDGAKVFSWHEEERFIEWVKPHLDNILDLQFAGGEPLLSPSHIKILNLLVESGKAKQITLRYTTNGTILNSQIISAWASFKKVTISISIDDKNDVFEYIRQDAKWSTVLENLKRFDEMIGDTVHSVTLQPVPNVYNIFSVPQMPLWTLQTFKKISWATHLNFQIYPSWQSAYILTEKEKEKCLSICAEEIYKIENEISLKEDPRRINALVWLKSLQGTLVEKSWIHLRDDFKKNNSDMDVFRKTSGNFLATHYEDLF